MTFAIYTVQSMLASRAQHRIMRSGLSAQLFPIVAMTKDNTFAMDRIPEVADASFGGEMRCAYFIARAGVKRNIVGFQPMHSLFLFDAVLNQLKDLSSRVYLRRLVDSNAVMIDATVMLFQAYGTGSRTMPIEDQAALESFLEKHDIIAPRPWAWPMLEHFDTTCGVRVASCLTAAWEDHSYFKTHSNHVLSIDEVDVFYPHNMFIMRDDEFYAYISFWYEAVLRFAHEYGVSRSPIYAAASERILTLWLLQRRKEKPDLAYAEVPFITCKGASAENAINPYIDTESMEFPHVH